MAGVTGFKEKTVVITGAAGGLGKALCHQFGREGAKIAALDVDKSGLESLRKELVAQGIEAKAYFCDVTKEDDCNQAMQQVIQDFAAIHLLINNAGTAHRSPFVKTRPEVLKRIIDISLMGSIYCTSAAIESLVQNKGMVIGISSIAGFAPLCGRTGYAAAKHGLAGFLNTLRTEIEPDGVSVLLVYATYIATNVDKNSLDGDGNPNTQVKVPTGKVLMPDEAALAIYQSAVNKERQLLLGEIAQLSWDVYHSDPLTYEKLMMESNGYIIEK